MRIYPREDSPFKIIEEPSVTRQIVSARERWPRFDDIWHGITWLIARGMIVEERQFAGRGHYVYTYGGDAIAGFPRIVVVYRWSVEAYVLRTLLVTEPID
jgi:hypothetical protein